MKLWVSIFALIFWWLVGCFPMVWTRDAKQAAWEVFTRRKRWAGY
jgi:hypothetical protein